MDDYYYFLFPERADLLYEQNLHLEHYKQRRISLQTRKTKGKVDVIVMSEMTQLPLELYMLHF